MTDVRQRAAHQPDTITNMDRVAPFERCVTTALVCMFGSTLPVYLLLTRYSSVSEVSRLICLFCSCGAITLRLSEDTEVLQTLLSTQCSEVI